MDLEKDIAEAEPEAEERICGEELETPEEPEEPVVSEEPDEDDDDADGDIDDDDDGIGDDDDDDDDDDDEDEAEERAEASVGDAVFTVIASLIGAVLSPLPAVICAYLIGAPFYPLFIAAPLLIYLFNKLLRGSAGMFATVLNVVLSLATTYITAIACQAGLYVSATRQPLYRIPGLTIEAIGKPGVLPSSASAYAYPLVFTVLGIFIILELFRAKRKQSKKS